MKKILYIILDGLADGPIKEFGARTPLEAALTPNMDKLARQGESGTVYVAEKGMAVESDVAILNLFGCDTRKYYTGRGVLESFAQGLKVENGNIAFRVNFATVAEDLRTIVDRRAGRSLTQPEVEVLVKELNAKVILSNATFELKNTVGHRGVLVIRAMHTQLSAWITNTDPAYERDGMLGLARDRYESCWLDSRPMPGYEGLQPAWDAAQLLNEFTIKANTILSSSEINKSRIAKGKLAANFILARDAGDHLPQFPSLKDRYGVKFGFFAQMPMEKGIALLTGAIPVDVPSLSGHPDIDYAVWSKIAVNRIKDFDVLCIQIKGPGEAGHDGDFKKKKACIESIDKYFFKHLMTLLKNEDVVIAVTSDHATSCILKTNTSDFVPLVIAGYSIKPDGSLSFSEKAARDGSLGEISGIDLMGFLVKLAK